MAARVKKRLTDLVSDPKSLSPLVNKVLRQEVNFNLDCSGHKYVVKNYHHDDPQRITVLCKGVEKETKDEPIFMVLSILDIGHKSSEFVTDDDANEMVWVC